MAIPDIIASLKEDIAHLPEYFADIRSSGKIIACLPCDFLPFEILRSQGIHPFVLPSLYRDNPHAEELPLDAVIAPERCFAALRGHKTAVTIAVREIPEGYGDASLAPWKALIADIVHTIKGDGITCFSNEALRDEAKRISALRRLVRGISLVRREKPDALSNAECGTIFEAALALPPEVAIPKLSGLLDALNDFVSSWKCAHAIPAMAFGCLRGNWKVLDALEREGFLIAEDDCCSGRRSFDLSYNIEHEHLFNEIVSAFSFRPFCPCLRSASSRFELLYRLAGSYGIETVILFDDAGCPARSSHIARMRPMLMRLGIDPLVLSFEHAVEEARRYIEYASR